MLHFGYKSAFVVLLSTFIVSYCIHSFQPTKVYNEQEMAKLATLTRTVMNIVRSYYVGKPFPASLNEDQILEIVRRNNTDFDELKLLNRYDLMMVSNSNKFAAIAWDPQNNRKLLQDLRCTPKLDDPTWRQVVFGQEITLNWAECNS